jgi:hypothetical protein
VARQLANLLNAPVFDLDEIAYVGGAGPKRSLAERLEDVAAIANQPTWLTEGIYLWWVGDLWRAADAIVCLDVPWRIAAWRIVLRHVRASLAGTNRHPGFGQLLRFVIASHRYCVDPLLRAPCAPDEDGLITRAQTAKELADYRCKLIRCSGAADVAAFLRRV